MKKAIQIIMLSLCILGFNFGESYSQTTSTVTLESIDATSFHTGDVINVPVRAYALSNVGSLGLWISFNTAALTYVRINSINPLISNISANFDGTYIRCGWFDMGSVGVDLDNTILFNIQFTYKLGSSPLNFYTTKCSFGDFTTLKPITVKYVNGEVLNLPLAFSLTFPTNNNYAYPTPLFQWNASSGVKYYKLYIDNHLVKDSLTTNSYQLLNSEALTKTSHSWYVVAYNRLGATQSTESWIVKIKSFPKGFALIAPQSGSSAGPCNLKFSWYTYQDSPYPLTAYQLYISGYDPIILSPSDTTYTFPQSLPYGSKTWYVIAVDSMGNLQNSSTYILNIQRENIYHIDGNLSYDNNIHSVLGNVKVVLKDVNNVKIDSTITDNTGYFIFNNLPNGNYTLTSETTRAVGGIDPVDGLVVVKYFVKLVQIDDALKLKSANVNADNSVNPSDALNITKYFIKTKLFFESGKWLFEKPAVTVDCADKTVNFKGICYGDVNGSFKP